MLNLSQAMVCKRKSIDLTSVRQLPLFFFILLFLPACTTSIIPTNNVYKTASGKGLIITETHPIGLSLSNIAVKSIGFEHNISEVLKNRDPIKKVLVADLDRNGFDEFYIITVAAGSGSYGNVIGLASNRDKSLSFIHFPDSADEEVFAEYMGHDLFSIENNQLVRSFPIGNRKIRCIKYQLIRGEASWQLKIIHHSTSTP